MPRRSGFFQHAGEAAVGDEPHERDADVNRAGNPCAKERQWNGEGRGKFEIQNPKHETSLKSAMSECRQCSKRGQLRLVGICLIRI
jgi:hypothetical protein